MSSFGRDPSLGSILVSPRHGSETRTFSSIEQFLRDRCGDTGMEKTRPIRKILVANNGIAAVKCMRSIRQWCYHVFGNENVVNFVAMATPEDLKAGAEYIKIADVYEEVPGGKNNRNYANVDVIVDVAKRHGCDAVWAGWGHASEFPALPASLAEAGIVFLGPGATAMRDLGDKIASTILAQSANVSCIPWSGDGVTVDYASEGIPEDKFLKCCVATLEDARKAVERIGLPVMIKASEGGGGKGIRKVEKMEQLEESFRRVQAEVPGSPIFLMRMGHNCRHLEVQVLGDAHGNALALYGRDCSIQRRHQKVIEEGPVVVANSQQCREMELAAVRLAKLVGYSGAGTIEYLFTEGKYYFLELNPRLQVEHPVTELISDVNLPATQLCIGMGLPLDRIPHIRAMWNRAPYGVDPIDFVNDLPRRPKGHCIAARITAENALKGFQPTSGTVQELTFRGIPNVWGYFSIRGGGGVHEFADSQFGHLFAWGPDRDYCRNTLILGLKELSIRGDISTTVDYLIRLMETDDFRNNTTSTAWLDSLIAAPQGSLVASPQDDSTVVICGAVFQAWQKMTERRTEFLSQLTVGRVPAKQLLEARDRITLVYRGTEYVCDVRAAGAESFLVEFVIPKDSAGTPTPSNSRTALNSSMMHGGEVANVPLTSSNDAAGSSESAAAVLVEVRSFADGGLLVNFDGHSRTCYLSATPPSGWKMIIENVPHVLEQQKDPTKIYTPSNGKILKYLVPNRTRIKAGTAFVECEIMKMVLPLICEVDGIISFTHAEGTVLTTGELVARVELDDLTSVKTAKPNKMPIPRMGPPRAAETKPDLRLREVQRLVDSVMGGYHSIDVRALATEYLDTLQKPTLALAFFQQSFSEHKAVLAPALKSSLADIVAQYEKDLKGALDAGAGAKLPVFPGVAMRNALEAWAIKMADGERSTWLSFLSGFLSVLGELATWDPMFPEVTAVSALFQRYFDEDDIFEGKPQEVALMDLRDRHKSDLETVYRISLSQHNDRQKVEFLHAILLILKRASRFQPFIEQLRRLYLSSKPRHVKLSLIAGTMLGKAETLLPEKRMELLRQQVAAVSDSSPDFELQARVRDLMSRTAYPLDTLSCAFEALDSKPRLAQAVVAEYVSALHGSIPFLRSSAQVSATAPRLNFEWEYPPFDFGDQGVPQAQKATSAIGTTSTTTTTAAATTTTTSTASTTTASAPRRCKASIVATVLEAEQAFGTAVSHFVVPNDASTRNILLLVILDARSLHSFNDALGRSQALEALLAPHVKVLTERRIVRVTIVLGRFPDTPFLHSFRLRSGFAEDPLYRNLVPEMAFLMELRRLDRYELERCSVESARILVYSAKERLPPGSTRAPASREFRLFVRAAVNTTGVQAVESQTDIDWSASAFKDYFTKHSAKVEGLLRKVPAQDGIKMLRLLREVEKCFVEALNALQATISGLASTSQERSVSNSIFISVMTGLQIGSTMAERTIDICMATFADRINAFAVHLLELVICIPRAEDGAYEMRRFTITNNSGYLWRVTSSTVMHSLALGVPSPRLGSSSDGGGGGGAGEKRASPDASLTPYIPNAKVSRRRMHCRSLNTTYVYDLLDVLERALAGVWSAHHRTGGPKHEGPLFHAVEYRLDAKDVIHPLSEPAEPGSNDIGMVAWRLVLNTPEYPKGRAIMLIANDVSFEGGSFGPREDALYHQASELSRKEGIPRIYVSANAGARIGLADELLNQFQVAWKDMQDPTRGFDYLYVTPEVAQKFASSLKVRPVPEHPNERMEILDIIGAKHGIGVENLQGSGLIAGETALAYKEVFTLTIVTGRSVGIGAYVTRLGQRVIQSQGGPILLTGYDALNRLLGRDVYISHTQMGGPHIMYRNGVSHIDAPSDLDSFRSMLRWLSYVPERVNCPLPIIPMSPLSDPVSRPVEWHPQAGISYDPRLLLTGETQPGSNVWKGGFFDRGSWMETLGGWARTVVTGRARLGGIPVGVIAVETRTVQKAVPADPASEDSREQISQQAGQVWYPDSAFKTAQAIWDFNAGEQLPLFIFANWRGFSGGVSDMFNEVLKFGSMIVDALSVYKQPVFVYLPPFAELRGGSWAVIDPFVNPFGMMEMFSSESAQGGILESTGTVAIKFRKREQEAAMHRLDPKLQELKLLQSKLSGADKAAMDAQISGRIEELNKLYHLIALRFCELHDTPGRMLEKKVISKIIPWEKSREFFGHRLRRRLVEAALVDQLRSADARLSVTEAQAVLLKDYHGANDDDVAVAAFLNANKEKLERLVAQKKLRPAVVNIATAVSDDKEGLLLDELISTLDDNARASLLEKLQQHQQQQQQKKK